MNQENWDNQRKQPHEPYHFTSDELRVLRECNRESFYQRSLPLGTMMGLGTYYAVKAGYLSGSVRWGPTPKVILACIAGYFVGKLSYQKTCAEKMMSLPNSPLAEMLRKKRHQGGGTTSITDSFGMDSNLSTPQVSDSFEVYSDHGPRSMDLDITIRPQDSSVGDIRPEQLDAFIDEEPLPPAQSNTTYEELRRQNREEYEKRRSAPRNAFPGVEDPSTRNRSMPAAAPPSTDQNEYGDTWIR